MVTAENKNPLTLVMAELVEFASTSQQLTANAYAKTQRRARPPLEEDETRGPTAASSKEKSRPQKNLNSR